MIDWKQTEWKNVDEKKSAVRMARRAQGRCNWNWCRFAIDPWAICDFHLKKHYIFIVSCNQTFALLLFFMAVCIQVHILWWTRNNSPWSVCKSNTATDHDINRSNGLSCIFSTAERENVHAHNPFRISDILFNDIQRYVRSVIRDWSQTPSAIFLGMQPKLIFIFFLCLHLHFRVRVRVTFFQSDKPQQISPPEPQHLEFFSTDPDSSILLNQIDDMPSHTALPPNYNRQIRWASHVNSNKCLT